MASAGPSIVYRRYRAPTQHGEVFADPPLADIPSIVAAHRGERPFTWLDSSSHVALKQAREEVTQLADRYTRQYRDVSLPALLNKQPAILMAGHQPQLFHPGVWYKNFELGRLAARMSAIAVNLIVDNDAVGHAAIRVPTGSIAQPRIENVAFDSAAELVPFEEHTIQDRSLFDSFSERVQKYVRGFIPDPLIEGWWPTAIDAASAVGNLGRALARARHQLEGEWGLQTLELPLSTICDTDAFRHWMAHVLLDLARFQQIYNGSLQEYRRVNHVRSRAHPAPELLADGQWLEAPFWLWTNALPRRGRLFVRRAADRLELTDRAGLQFAISISTSQSTLSVVEGLAALAASGVKVRSRALATTLYVRMCLCDLFIHGIGGGKYDQLTDALMQRFFGVHPPKFCVLTATAKLPLPSPSVQASELTRTEFLLRELEFNPDRHLQPSPASRPIVESKQRWLKTEWSRGSGKQRHEGIRQANRDLQPFVRQQRHELLEQREQLARLLRNDRLLGARDYSFCLFPKRTLQALLLDKC